MLGPARRGKYAVGLFNAVDIELARGILRAAERTRSPVILGTAEVLFPFGPLAEVADYVLPMARRAGVPVVAHLDHGLKRETCIQALELGFTSIMYDCSAEPYEENVRKVRELAAIAHSRGASVEGELGHVGNNDDPADERDPARCYTDPLLAREYVERTGVDALAVAVGNAHGAYKYPPKLDFRRIGDIAAAVPVPLVLHGGSGLTDDDFRRAIREGISKVNIFTDINCAAGSAAGKILTAGAALTDAIPAVVEAVAAEAEKKLRLFGSGGHGACPGREERK